MKKKIELQKRYRVFFILIALLIISAGIIFIVKEVKFSGYSEERNILYSFNNKEDINYKVFLKPNILYDTDSLGEDEIYISEFIDYIDAAFKYEFTGEKEANIQGKYEIIAQMEGYTGNEKEGTLRTVWTKYFTIVPAKDIQVRDKILSIEENIKLNWHEYNDLVLKVLNVSKVSIPVKMNVFMNVELKISTIGGTKELKHTPYITIPLNTNYFQIVKKVSKENPGSFERVEQIPLPIDNFKIGIFSSIELIAWLILAFIIFKTKSTKRTPLEIELIRIFKKYGDRLVALKNEAIVFEKYSEVQTIEDLVRIADELARPIMYKHNASIDKILKFYVFDEKIMYILNINASEHPDGPPSVKGEEGEAAESI